jgi:hypothetical protein
LLQYRIIGGGFGLKGKQRFFFEKKNQKTFSPQVIACGAAVASIRVPGRKVFLLLFVHKKKSSSLS